MITKNARQQSELTTVLPAFTRADEVAKGPHLSPIVTIFGAGIAGLSAAHELIERGFAVQIVEPTRSPDEEYAAEVGGLARNQFGRVQANPFELHRLEETKLPEEDHRALITEVLRFRSREMQPVQPRFEVPWRIRFERTDARTGESLDPLQEDEWGVINRVKLSAAWEAIKKAYFAYTPKEDRSELKISKEHATEFEKWLAREHLYVEIRGHTNGDYTESENRELSSQWADEVRSYLREMNRDEGNPVKHFEDHFVTKGVGSAEPIGDQRDENSRLSSNRVEFRIVEQLVPGEHGYRFFPAFYRHLFDIMRRTPILDNDNHATGQTAFDRLVPTTDLGLALADGRPLATIETRRVRSLEELRKLLELFLSRLGMTHRDIARFQVRMLKFLTSSSERRRREYERQSWWRFLGGDDERGYSAQMQRYLMETSQALVAMNAKETDARSQGNIVSQLQLHYLQDSSDLTLNGPTSDVWLRPWKRYLKRQGVRFFVGELSKLEWRDDKKVGPELVPITTHRSGWLKSPGRRIRTKAPESHVEPPIARPEQRAVIIEVLDNQDGDYEIHVSKKVYCVTARGLTGPEIATKLANAVNLDPWITAKPQGSRILVRAKVEVRFPDLGEGSSFDDSRVAGAWRVVRTIRAKWLSTPMSKAVQKELLNKVMANRPKATEENPHPHALEFQLTDQEWVQTGRLRLEDSEFDKHLRSYEEALKRKRELVPCIEIDDEKKEIVLKPPDWIEKHLWLADPERVAEVEPVAPYYFRAKPGGIESAPTIWIQVRNADENLRIVDEPMAEEPTHNYLSFSERPRAFRPDFYVLALPLVEASRLVWRAETQKPGVLHGCLAELLEFDRRTFRRTMSGAAIRTIRDSHGRPPLEYPLRDFAGVQYYFHNQVRIGKGHIYFPRAEWGLSSISQLAYWRERMSPAGPFMGQLSVDIGNFYNPAPPRLGSRLKRSGWNSTSPEIAAEVWFQVRQGLERERAGILSAPSYFHIDEGLSFNDPRGSTFRERAVIQVADDPNGAMYTVWVHNEHFSTEGSGQPNEIARRLEDLIKQASFGSIDVSVDRFNDRHSLLTICSTIPHGAALIVVTGGQPGGYEVTIGSKTYVYAQAPASRGRPSDVRDGLFQQLVSDPDLCVTAELSESAGIRLFPKGSDELPSISVRSDHHGLNVLFGPTLHVRLEQCNGGLSFTDEGAATIGYNNTPFLINVPGQWQHRPGLFQPDELTFEETVLRPGDDDRVRYRISNQRWVAAGTYMATTTQLTTMEAANESARHAVNAILRCLAARTGNEYNAQGRVFADLAEIWDPEKSELDDLEPLKRLDRKLVEEGLPHVMDILKVIEAVDAMPMHGKPSDDPATNILHLLQHLADGSDRDWAFIKQTIGDFLGQAVERVHDGLDPFGVLRELRNGPANVADRLRQVLQSMMERTGGRPSDAGSGRPGG